MRLPFALALALLIVGCQSNPQVAERHVLELHYVPPPSSAISPIDCGMFGDFFDDAAYTTIVNDPVYLDSLAAALTAANRQAVSRDSFLNDARLIGFYRHGGRTDTLCAGDYVGVEVNGALVRDDSLLHALLWSGTQRSR